jgi:opacity protein-like surface antigen
VQYTYSSSNYGFQKSARPLISEILRETGFGVGIGIEDLSSMPNRHTSGSGFGGFVGYNSQWGDVVMGLEANYTRVGGPTAFSSDAFTSGAFSIASNASARLTDLGSVRLRGGYAWGWLMPYGMVGVAVGRADVARQATVFNVPNGQIPPLLGTDPAYTVTPNSDPLIATSDVTHTQRRNGAITWGYMFGAGVDIGLFPGMFLRAEWELTQLSSVLGVPISINSFHVGAALKF